MKVQAVFDHFIVEMDQEAIDNERKRMSTEQDEIKELQKKKKRIITSINTDTPDDAKSMVIEYMIKSPVHTVHSAGRDCEYVKPGDKVIVRRNAVPELSIINDKAYFSFAEKSISVYLGQEKKK